MSNNCLEQITEGQDRLFMLLDSWINGTQYAELDGEISPPLPRVPASTSTAANSARAQLARLYQLAENAATAAEFDANSAMEGTTELDYFGSWTARARAIQGTLPGGWFEPDKPVQFLDLLKAARVNNDDDKSVIGQAIDEVDSALDVGTDLGNFIKGFFDSAAELGTDGGLIAVQLAVGAAQARLMQRMIKALDGGELIGPGGPGNNLLRSARAAAYDDAGELASGQTLANISEQLDDLANRVRGESDGAGSVVSAIERLRLQLSGLAALDDLDNPTAGIVIAGLEEILNCICVGVSGTPAAVTWPDPAQPCGSLWPTAALRAQVSLSASDITGDDVYRATVGEWTVVEGGAGITWTVTPPGMALLAVGGPVSRELCVSYQLPTGATDPGPISINFNPHFLSGTYGPANRPYIQTNGSASNTYEFFPSNADGDPIGYQATVAGPNGTPVNVPIRIYIHSGGLG